MKKKNKKSKIKPPILGMRTIPDGSDNPVLAGAFAGLVRFAMTKSEFVMAFEKYSMKKMLPTLIPEFADWVNIHLWGKL